MTWAEFKAITFPSVKIIINIEGYWLYTFVLKRLRKNNDNEHSMAN